MWPSDASNNIGTANLFDLESSFRRGSVGDDDDDNNIDDVVDSSEDYHHHENFMIATRTQLLWGENNLLCGNLDEASRTFLRVIVSFEQNGAMNIKERGSSAASTTASTLSIPMNGCSHHRIQSQSSASSLQVQVHHQQQQQQQYQQQQQQYRQQSEQQQRQQRRQQIQTSTLLGSALYGLGTTYMLQGYFTHAQSALQQAVHLYWQLYGEGNPLLELAKTQLHRLYCYWEMVTRQQQQQQQLLLQHGAYQRHFLQEQQQNQRDDLALTQHFRQDVLWFDDHNEYGDDDDDDHAYNDEVDDFLDDDETYSNHSDDIVMFPEDDELDDDGFELDLEHHSYYCRGEFCRMFSMSVRHAAAA